MTTEKNNPADDIVCDCTGTTFGKIQTLYEEGFSLNAICSKTGANTGCGGCEWEIEEFIKVLDDLK